MTKRAAIVLASGKGSRFGSDKLLALLRGEPLITHALRAACAAPVDRVVVVARTALPLTGDPRIQIVAGGDVLSASLKAGLAAVADCDAAFIFLGDMPLVPHGLAAHLAEWIGTAIAAVPEVAGRPGHPVLLASAGFALAECLSGDEGLGKLLARRADVVRMPADDAGAARDIDTPAMLAALERHR